MDLKYNYCCPYKERKVWRYIDTGTHREEDNMMTEPEIGVIQLQSKELEGLAVVIRRHKRSIEDIFL